MNNKGMSLVEILIVIAILGIVASTATISFNALNTSNVKSVSKSIDSYMSKLKTENMSKSSLSQKFIRVIAEDGKYYMTFCSQSELSTADKGERIGSRSVDIELVKEGALSSYEISESSTYTGFGITFSREGKISYCDLNANPFPDNIESIKVSNGNKVKNIVTVTDTGKFYIE